jgi:hypothetical protein
LEPPADQIWYQGALGRSVLVLAHPTSDTGYAYLKVGPLPTSTTSIVATFGRISTILLVSDDFLPDALQSVEQSIIAAKQAWGGLLAATIHG